MPPGLTLTATDRVLLHLKDHLHHADESEYPQAITQKGISDATGLRLQHVPRTLKSLEDRDLVSSEKGHVRGESRRYKVYFLTGRGLEEANVILKRAMAAEAETAHGHARVGDLLAGCKGPILPALRELAGESLAPAKAERAVAGPVPKTEGFVGRGEELEELGRMLADPELRFIIVYASQGYGASALAARFVEGQPGKWSVAWVEAGKDLAGFQDALAETLGAVAEGADASSPKKLVQSLDGEYIILVIDNYFDCSEDMVEFLVGLVAASRPSKGLKILVTAREDTPPYNRFYTIVDLHDGIVGEVHLRGLDMEHCRELLGTPDIDPDALKRLFLFTKGKPPTLKLLAEGDERKLAKHTTFSPEEIKLMLFLKGQRKK